VIVLAAETALETVALEELKALLGVTRSHVPHLSLDRSFRPASVTS
jgi:hypothetical protein